MLQSIPHGNWFSVLLQMAYFVLHCDDATRCAMLNKTNIFPPKYPIRA